jgi:Leucine-rich repeat (LRR) protein
LQFGLRTLLAVTLVCSTALGWVESRRRYYARQVEAAKTCHTAQFTLEPVGPDWLRSLWGETAFQRVVEARFHGDHRLVLRDADLAVLRELPELRRILAGTDPYGFRGQFDFLRPIDSLLSDAGLEALGQLRQVQELDLSGCKIDGSGLRWISRDAPLSTLRLNGIEFTDEGLVQIASFAHLEVLELGDASLPTAEPLARLAKLRELDLQRAYVSDHDWRPVGRLTSLEVLNLRSAQIDQQHFDWLANLTALQELSLESTTIRDQDLTCLNSLPALRRLDLDATRVSSACLIHFAGLSHLEVLHLRHTQVNDTEMDRLTHLTSLRELGLHGTNVSGASVPTLERLAALTDLEITYDRFTTEEVQRLCTALPNCDVTPYLDDEY